MDKDSVLPHIFNQYITVVALGCCDDFQQRYLTKIVIRKIVVIEIGSRIVWVNSRSLYAREYFTHSGRI